MRLPQVHDARHQGRIALHIRLARQKGWVAYVGQGEVRLPAAHVADVVRLYRLALEKGRSGARYHAEAEEGVPLRDIAEVIGAGLGAPVRSIAPEAAADYFGGLAGLAVTDLAASGAPTRQALDWTPDRAGPADGPAQHGLQLGVRIRLALRRKRPSPRCLARLFRQR